MVEHATPKEFSCGLSIVSTFASSYNPTTPNSILSVIVCVASSSHLSNELGYAATLSMFYEIQQIERCYLLTKILEDKLVKHFREHHVLCRYLRIQP